MGARWTKEVGAVRRAHATRQVRREARERFGSRTPVCLAPTLSRREVRARARGSPAEPSSGGRERPGAVLLVGAAEGREPGGEGIEANASALPDQSGPPDDRQCDLVAERGLAGSREAP